MKNHLLIFILSISTGCLSGLITRPAEMQHPESSMLGIRISGPYLNAKPDTVYFAKLKEDSGAILEYDEVVNSNYIAAHGIFLLNAAPGTYAVIGAKYIFKHYTEKDFGRTTVTTLFFPEEMVLISRSKVKSGEMVFAGEFNVHEYVMDKSAGNVYEFKSSFRRDTRDTLSLFYRNIFPQIDERIFQLPGDHTYTISVLNRFYKNTRDERRFYLANSEEFIGTRWHKLMINKIESLKEEPIRKIRIKL